MYIRLWTFAETINKCNLYTSLCTAKSTAHTGEQTSVGCALAAAACGKMWSLIRLLWNSFVVSAPSGPAHDTRHGARTQHHHRCMFRKIYSNLFAWCGQANSQRNHSPSEAIPYLSTTSPYRTPSPARTESRKSTLVRRVDANGLPALIESKRLVLDDIRGRQRTRTASSSGPTIISANVNNQINSGQ